MQTASSQSSPAPAVDVSLPTNEDAIDVNVVTEEPVVSIEVDLLKNMLSTLEQIRDELKLNNANEEHGGLAEGSLAKNMSDTLEQTLDNGTKPNNANENPAVSIEGSLAKNMSGTLGQILDVLKGSTISEERGKDDSKFWATYKKVSTEYDDDFLRRTNDDMGIILTFAGLFSAVNSTFIIGMQPNPAETTNVLLLDLIRITVNGPNSVPDIGNLSSSTGYPSSTVWMQTLAYASLAFSVLAAFGAVMGKQWLNSYKTARGRGTLEERGMQRQMKLDGLEYFRLQTVLQAFLVLLQISLLLFGLSLSANVWTQQTTISSVIICTTAFGILFYVGTNLVSALRPNNPFQTPASELFVTICKIILPKKFIFAANKFVKLSAIRWILETSTNPEIVEAAAAIVPCVQWPPNLDATASYARLLDNFPLCRDRPELYTKYHKAMAHLCMQPVKIDSGLLEKRFWDNKFEENRSRFIRDAFMAGRAAYRSPLFLAFRSGDRQNWQQASRQKHQADVRIALRTMVVHSQFRRLSRPEDECLIWNGDLRWHHSEGHKPSCEEFDWLVNYLAGNSKADDETMGDALLALSAMQGLGSSTKQRSYISSLIHCMDSARPPRVRHAAFRAVFEAREELASINSASMPRSVDTQLLDELSRAILTVVRPKDGQTTHDTGPDASCHIGRDSCYIRIIYALTRNEEWFQRLTCDGHDERCISLVEGACQERYSPIGFYLLVIFGRIKYSGKDLPFSPVEERWRLLIKNAWHRATHIGLWSINDVDRIPAFVTATRLNLTASDDGVPREWLTDLTAEVRKVLVGLQRRQADLVDDGRGQAAIDAVLSSIQGLHGDLSCIVEQRGASQKDSGASGP